MYTKYAASLSQIFFFEDFQKILYKIAVLETNCPSDGSKYGSEWTMWELHQSSMESEQQMTQQPANTWLISPNNYMGKQEDYALGNKFKNIIPCCNILGAKPKIKLFPSDMGDQVTGAQRFVIQLVGLRSHLKGVPS